MAIAVWGGHAFYQNYNRYLRVLDLTDPLNPVQIASYRLNDYLREMKFTDDRLYAVSFGYLAVFDITDFEPWTPLANIHPLDGDL